MSFKAHFVISVNPQLPLVCCYFQQPVSATLIELPFAEAQIQAQKARVPGSLLLYLHEGMCLVSDCHITYSLGFALT